MVFLSFVGLIDANTNNPNGKFYITTPFFLIKLWKLLGLQQESSPCVTNSFISSLFPVALKMNFPYFFCFLYSIYFIETHMHDFTSSHLLNEPSSLKCPAISLRCKPSVRAFTLGSPPKTESCIFRKVFRGAIDHSPNSQQNDYYRWLSCSVLTILLSQKRWILYMQDALWILHKSEITHIDMDSGVWCTWLTHWCQPQLLTLFVTGQKKEEESLLIISQNSKISKNVCQLLISGLDFLSSVWGNGFYAFSDTCFYCFYYVLDGVLGVVFGGLNGLHFLLLLNLTAPVSWQTCNGFN